MTAVDYSKASVPVRDDIAQCHGRMLAHITTTGTWWDGEERAAIARSVACARSCAFCGARKEALSPYAIDGDHDDDSGLEPIAVDVIHRLVTDPGRLSSRWYEDAVASDTLDPERFVELIAVAIFANALHVFARAVGVDPVALPAPTPGSPSGHRPEGLEAERAWVPRLSPGGGPDWTRLYGEREQVAEVELALSLVPAEVEILSEIARVHYMAFPNVTVPHHVEPNRAIDRMQMEFVASRVSTFNDCFY